MKKLFIATLGCKVNQFESASFKTGFEESDYQLVQSKEEANLVIINTCAVTASAGSQSRQIIRQCLRRNPTARVIITGCYAEIDSDKITALDEIQDRDFSIVGNSKKDELVALGLSPAPLSSPLVLGEIHKAAHICNLPVKKFGNRSRAYLRVQDGCENFCSYCIVPYTRGPSRSLKLPAVLEQAQSFVQEGHKEIVLTGIHLGNYGKDLQPVSDMIELLDTLSLKFADVSFRISSLEPNEINVELLSLMNKRNNIQPHLHIPLQSGNDDILDRMNRRYDTNQFRNVIELCHANLPDVCIGIDILAGFPGETDEKFALAKTFLQSLDFTYLHVFPYSKRPGTKAATMPQQVAKAEKNRRVAELLELSNVKRQTFYSNQLGKIRRVLFEGKKDKKGRLKGFSDNYIDVRLKGPDSLLNQYRFVKLISIDNSAVIGEIHEHDEN